MEFKQVGFLKRMANALTDKENLKGPILVKESTESVQLIEQYKRELEHTQDVNIQNPFMKK